MDGVSRPVATSVTPPGLSWRRLSRTGDTVILLLALAAAWQLLHRFAGDVAFTSPAGTAAHLGGLMGRPAFWANVAETGTALGGALLISGLGGIAFGVALGAHRFSGEVAQPLLIAAYALPKVTLYPVILLLFGLGLPAKIAFGAIHGIIPVTIFTMNAVRNIPPVLLRTARVMRLPAFAMARGVLVPAALPEIVTGLRVGFSLTLLGVLIGEMFASQRGLGFMITNAIGLNDTATILAVTLFVVVFAVAVNSAFLAIERGLRAP